MEELLFFLTPTPPLNNQIYITHYMHPQDGAIKNTTNAERKKMNTITASLRPKLDCILKGLNCTMSTKYSIVYGDSEKWPYHVVFNQPK